MNLAPQIGAYGTLPFQQLEAGLASKGKLAPKERFKPKQRTKFTCVGVCVSLFLPWILFTILYAVVTFKIHYSMPAVCWCIVFVAALVPLAFGAVAHKKLGEDGASASMLVFLAAACLVAVAAGTVLGDLNYWTNMQPYYELESLNTYQDVNPARNKGRQMMDAGVVKFLKGSTLDLGHAGMFQSIDNYCVAPVAPKNPSTGSADPLKYYDFWAVGLNCCGYNVTKYLNFKCGAYKSETARQGLRLLSENQRDFFRLAVQQAEAKYRITANQPIFFYWTEDAATDHASYSSYGVSHFWLGVGMFFLVQLFLLLVTSFAVSKLGY